MHWGYCSLAQSHQSVFLWPGIGSGYMFYVVVKHRQCLYMFCVGQVYRNAWYTISVNGIVISQFDPYSSWMLHPHWLILRLSQWWWSNPKEYGQINHTDNWQSTHWGRVTHICVSKLTSVGSDNGLSPGRRQAILWTSAGILLIGPLGRNFSENLIEIHIFSFKKMHLQMSSGKWRPFCLSLNELIKYTIGVFIIFTNCFGSSIWLQMLWHQIVTRPWLDWL